MSALLKYPSFYVVLIAAPRLELVGLRDSIMQNRHFLGWILVVAACCGAGQSIAADQPRPNIVLILADDLGWADLSCQGADLHRTPRLDQLAARSIRFSRAYAMPVCSPSRAALMTGKNPARLPMTIWSEGSRQGPKDQKLLQAESLHNLPHSEKSIATWLKEAGYFTALVGKWHLGDADHYPETHGFDVNIGGTHWGQPRSFWWPYRGREKPGGEYRYVPHLEFGKPGEYLTDRLTDEAIRVIDQTKDQPFFLYLAHHAPHKPIEAKPQDIDFFERRKRPGMKQQNTAYAAMVKNLDLNVGRVLDHLEAKGLLDNTMVIFASDNGGYIGTDHRQKEPVPITSNFPLRSGKGSLYEGGIRVPLIIKPAGWKKPGLVITENVTLMDLFATLFQQTFSKEPPAPCDGEDLSPFWKEPDKNHTRGPHFFHFPHYYETTTPASAVIQNNWKLIHFHEDNRYELYRLDEDPSEKINLVETQPVWTFSLKGFLFKWQMEIQAKFPQPNAAYKPKEEK